MQSKKQIKLGKEDGRNINIPKLVLVLVLAFATISTYHAAVNETLPISGDSSTYVLFAKQMLAGTFRESNCIFSVRLAEIIPTAVSFYIFGVSTVSAILWQYASYIGLILVAFYMGSELLDERAGAIAAILLSVFPNVYISSQIIDPRLSVAFLIALGMLFLLYGERKRNGRYFLLSGISFALAPLVDPVGAVAFFALVIYLLYIYRKHTLNAKYAWIFCGIALVTVALLALNYYFSGDPLITFKLTNSFYNLGVGNPEFGSVNVTQCGYLPLGPNNSIPYLYGSGFWFYPIVAFHPPNLSSLAAFYGSELYQPNYTGLFYYVVIGSAVYLAKKKSQGRHFAFVAIWLLALFAYLEFGPMHIGLAPLSYTPILKMPGFMEIFSPLIAVLIAISLSMILREKTGDKKKNIGRYLFVTFVIVLLIASSIYPDLLVPIVPG